MWTSRQVRRRRIDGASPTSGGNERAPEREPSVEGDERKPMTRERKPFEIRVEGQERSYPCRSGDTILRAALRSGLPFPYECNSGSCGSCKFELLAGEVETMWPEAPGLSERDKRKGKRLGCQSRPVCDCLIRFRPDEACLPRRAPRVFWVELVLSRPLTHDMIEFRFKADAPADFLPGQYALLHLPGVPGLRAYSMSNLPNAEGLWEFQIKKVPNGAASTVLFDRLDRGDRIPIDAPYGLAYLRTESARDMVCIAGGSGIGPMISIARGKAVDEILERRTLDFFYGARGPEDICGRDMLEELPGFSERIYYRPVISMPKLDREREWTGPVGFVHELVSSTLTDFGAREYYLAGPPAMVDATLGLLVREKKVPVKQIHYDRFY